VGGLEAAEHGGTRPASGGGYLFGAGRKKVPWGFSWAGYWAECLLLKSKGKRNGCWALWAELRKGWKWCFEFSSS
jgi:hypothetical protein